MNSQNDGLEILKWEKARTIEIEVHTLKKCKWRAISEMFQKIDLKMPAAYINNKIKVAHKNV